MLAKQMWDEESWHFALEKYCFAEQEAFEKCWAHSPLRAAARRIAIHQVSLLSHAALSHAACASMSTTTTTTRDRGDRCGPIEWTKLGAVFSWTWSERSYTPGLNRILTCMPNLLPKFTTLCYHSVIWMWCFSKNSAEQCHLSVVRKQNSVILYRYSLTTVIWLKYWHLLPFPPLFTFISFLYFLSHLNVFPLSLAPLAFPLCLPFSCCTAEVEKVTLFHAFLQAGLTDLDEIWHDGRT